MLRCSPKLRVCSLAVTAMALIGACATTAQAFFPQSQPPFVGVDPLPPIIIIDIPPPVGPPPPVHKTPEPGTMALGLIGAGIAGAIARRRKQRSAQ
jgi:hypothetical protein